MTNRRNKLYLWKEVFHEFNFCRWRWSSKIFTTETLQSTVHGQWRTYWICFRGMQPELETCNSIVKHKYTHRNHSLDAKSEAFTSINLPYPRVLPPSRLWSKKSRLSPKSPCWRHPVPIAHESIIVGVMWLQKTMVTRLMIEQALLTSAHLSLGKAVHAITPVSSSSSAANTRSYVRKHTQAQNPLLLTDLRPFLQFSPSASWSQWEEGHTPVPRRHQACRTCLSWAQ